MNLFEIQEKSKKMWVVTSLSSSWKPSGELVFNFISYYRQSTGYVVASGCDMSKENQVKENDTREQLNSTELN
jgi:hypothetical protein